MAIPFHPVVWRWFSRRFGNPTPPQELGWESIAQGKDTLIAAPTGSGKTLAAWHRVIEPNAALLFRFSAIRFNLNGLDSPQLAAQNLFPYRSPSFPHVFSGNPGSAAKLWLIRPKPYGGDVRTRPPLETCGGDN